MREILGALLGVPARKGVGCRVHIPGKGEGTVSRGLVSTLLRCFASDVLYEHHVYNYFLLIGSDCPQHTHEKNRNILEK